MHLRDLGCGWAPALVSSQQAGLESPACKTRWLAVPVRSCNSAMSRPIAKCGAWEGQCAETPGLRWMPLGAPLLSGAGTLSPPAVRGANSSQNVFPRADPLTKDLWTEMTGPLCVHVHPRMCVVSAHACVVCVQACMCTVCTCACVCWRWLQPQAGRRRV